MLPARTSDPHLKDPFHFFRLCLCTAFFWLTAFGGFSGLMPSLPSLPSLPFPFAESPLNASEVSGREKCPENGESTELADFQWRSHQ